MAPQPQEKAIAPVQIWEIDGNRAIVSLGDPANAALAFGLSVLSDQFLALQHNFIKIRFKLLLSSKEWIVDEQTLSRQADESFLEPFKLYGEVISVMHTSTFPEVFEVEFEIFPRKMKRIKGKKIYEALNRTSFFEYSN